MRTYLINNFSKKFANSYKIGGINYVIGKIIYKVLFHFRNIAPKVFYNKIEMYVKLYYWPNLKNPHSFNEKLNYRKIFAPHPLSNIVANKWAVREYVLKKRMTNLY